MQVEYDGESYEFDLEEIDVVQADAIKRQLGLTLLGIERGLADGDPSALRAAFWLMLSQSGKKVALDRVNFKPVKFIRAFLKAQEAEAKESGEEEKAPKEASQT